MIFVSLCCVVPTFWLYLCSYACSSSVVPFFQVICIIFQMRKNNYLLFDWKYLWKFCWAPLQQKPNCIICQAVKKNNNNNKKTVTGKIPFKGHLTIKCTHIHTTDFLWKQCLPLVDFHYNCNILWCHHAELLRVTKTHDENHWNSPVSCNFQGKQSFF